MKLAKFFQSNLDFVEKTDLNLREVALLQLIYIHAENGTHLNVTTAMDTEYIGSPASLHRYIDALLEKNMVETFTVGKSRRTKFLRPTNAAYKKIKKIFGGV